MMYRCHKISTILVCSLLCIGSVGVPGKKLAAAVTTGSMIVQGVGDTCTKDEICAMKAKAGDGCYGSGIVECGNECCYNGLSSYKTQCMPYCSSNATVFEQNTYSCCADPDGFAFNPKECCAYRAVLEAHKEVCATACGTSTSTPTTTLTPTTTIILTLPTTTTAPTDEGTHCDGGVQYNLDAFRNRTRSLWSQYVNAT